MRRRGNDIVEISADVLVVGGGPAATWAAVAAAQAGARVVLVDKGYVGTSGATAPANTGTWSPPPGERRQAAIAARMPRTGGLADPHWVERTLDTVWEKLHCLAEWGHPFPLDDNGGVYRANLRGPDYTCISCGAGCCAPGSRFSTIIRPSNSSGIATAWAIASSGRPG